MPFAHAQYNVGIITIIIINTLYQGPHMPHGRKVHPKKEVWGFGVKAHRLVEESPSNLRYVECEIV